MSRIAKSLESLPRDVVLLAPASNGIPGCFRKADSPLRHRRLLHSMQRLRGSTYLSDGAIAPWQLTEDGRYEQPIDNESWHILALDAEGNVCGCVRYHPQPNIATFRQLGVRESALASSPWWGGLLRVAIEKELAAARLEQRGYVELGGWAISAERRCTPEALRLALTTYALAQLLGGARGITTATVRHHSSTILRKIGGRSLAVNGTELPPYFDQRYGCQMEILQFDSRCPGDAYADFVDQLRARMPLVEVICARAVDTRQQPVRRHIPAAFVPAAWHAEAGVPANS